MGQALRDVVLAALGFDGDDSAFEFMSATERKLGFKVEVAPIIQAIEAAGDAVEALRMSSSTFAEIQKQVGTWWDGRYIQKAKIEIYDDLPLGFWALVCNSLIEKNNQ